ncbi:putative histidine triad (HIT) protein [Helianthus annuus]|uniref:Histidine triad (HIT) protein n=1 Tax=Helianthus annuus TaxID=4232 RepID=A0A251U815_HELAN|nr:adenylylsulfatase HINT3 isoform X1 [Helianthus annuus]KAF5796189.1 putative histidine triad (HIT) protein [Helianthus annuus]KAJ0547783.1 putative histidine triad (HIT) protein [Helianthus annuus]KAJ0554288.1 putative histidine triad (HIT) protein [Helianthus annuus]KAJ0898795.1 putative histidine triad (HIT) protein [Helianthus annuus]KAJ0902419.1 putative histidine triad (HIT) protein [Helianthus annuus]
MEAPQRRRLSIIASHLNPITTTASIVTRSHCSSSSDPAEKQCNLETDCVFCKIVRGDAPALKLYEDDECLCILDNQPVSPGHCLIIPRGHFPSLVATPPSVVAAMCSKVPYISKAVMKATGSDSFNLLVNNGVDAGQVIFHTHIHIIPRRPRDCLWASESLKRQPLKLDEEALHLVNNIRQQLSFVDGFEDNKDHGTTLIGSQ